MPGKGANAFDLIVVGAGINGAGIARDAAGRGLRVLVIEKDDIAAATSQWSTKLIHGGLRYLEYYEFRLVRESLSEREVVLRQAPHLVHPLQFVLPHWPHLRPAWMIRAGLFIRPSVAAHDAPGSFGVDLRTSKWGAGLKPSFERGFVYADAQVDDARLVLANAMSAREHGADIRVHTKLLGARRENGLWRATLEVPGGVRSEVNGKVIVKAGGPWVKAIRDTLGTTPSPDNVRHVKGSHIVVPRVHAERHAYILQNRDNRIVFVIPFDERYSLIGTTDIAVAEYEHPEISGDETRYLLELANTYLATPLTAKDVVWAFSGVRPLFDDGQSDPSAITRDYVLKLDDGGAPLLSVYGGKIPPTASWPSRLAELKPFLPSMQSATPRPRSPAAISRTVASTPVAEMQHRYQGPPNEIVRAVAPPPRLPATAVLDNAKNRGIWCGLRQRAHGAGGRRMLCASGRRQRTRVRAQQVRHRDARAGARARRGLRGANSACGRSASATTSMRPLATMPRGTAAPRGLGPITSLTTWAPHRRNTRPSTGWPRPASS
jgi:glycerol-3-phosphate dehydrogenase